MKIDLKDIKIKRIKKPLIPCYKEHLKKIHEYMPKYIPSNWLIKND